MSGGEIVGCTLQVWEMCARYKVCFGKSTLQCERGTKKYDEVCVVDMCVYVSLVDQHPAVWRSVVFTECTVALKSELDVPLTPLVQQQICVGCSDGTQSMCNVCWCTAHWCTPQCVGCINAPEMPRPPGSPQGPSRTQTFSAQAYK